MTIRLSHTQAAAMLGHAVPAKPRRRLRIVESQPRLVVDCVDIVLPKPPSTNSLFFNRASGGRGKTDVYRKWITEAGWRLVHQKPGSIVGRYEIEIGVPRSVNRKHIDLDNSSKCLIDLLVRHGVTADDRHLERLTIAWQSEDNGVRVIVRGWSS